jgi:hypothetical protein
VTDRRTPDATLIEAVRILSRTINTEDGVIAACVVEVATRLAELVEERRSISTLLQKVESLEAENNRLREERMTVDEREAIEMSLALEWPHTSEQWQALARCLGPVCKVPANKYKAAIHAFLARQPLPPGPEGAKPELPTD